MENSFHRSENDNVEKRQPHDDTNQFPPTSRLMITKMVLENFKSYGGVKEIGPFHKCFSAVVGPNGSGKSNVIDAMLFVFGKRAKKLRLNKVSELIHQSDSVKNNPPQYARVSVYFSEIIDTGDGDEDYRIVPNTDMIVTRIAKKDNSSNYKLNGKNSSFKEIANYLNSKGIDLDNNRFLILQGEVEMISMMPPKGKTENDEGLLEYLEDIIGSSKFVAATNEASQKVEALSEVRQEKLNRVKAVEREKDNLEGAKQEAEALLRAEREISRKQSILYQINAMKADKEVIKYTEQKIVISKQLEVERERVAQARERINEIETSLEEQRKDYKVFFAELTRTKEEFAAYERRDITLRETVKHERSNKEKLESKIKVEEKKESKAAEKKTKAENRIPKLESEIESLYATKAEEDAKLEELEEETKAETQNIRRKLEAMTTELAPVKQERAVLQAALDTALTELKIREDSTNRVKERLTSAETELEQLDETKESKRQTLKRHETEIVSAKEGIVRLEKEDRELTVKEEALGKRNRELLTQVEEVQSAIRSSGGAKSRSKAVQGILNASQTGGELSKVGVLGRLGDLATIHEQYDVAVSTACGMLDHIVVQTTAGAQRCLEFLRKYNLGRASFIPLDKQKKGAHDRLVETPEGAPRLFDFITPTNFAVAPAMYLAVGNTLVAPDLEIATRWAYDFSKRWRVVTLDGKLIETAGTMSGGGNKARCGGMRLSNSRSNVVVTDDDSEEDLIEKLNKQIDHVQSETVEIRQRRKEIKEELRNLIKTIKTIDAGIPKLRLEIDGCETTREELTKLIPNLREQSVVSQEEADSRKELENKVARCQADLSSCASVANKLEAKVSNLQEAILNAGGPALKKQKTSCEKILSSLNDTEKSLNSSKVEIMSADKAIAKSQKALKSLRRQLEACNAVLSEKIHELETLENEALAVVQAYDKVREIEEKKRKDLENASRDAEDLKKSQSDVQFAEIELSGKLDALKKQLVESERMKIHWQKEITRIQAAEEEFDLDDEEDSEVTGDETENLDADTPNNDAEIATVDEKDSSPHPEASPETLIPYGKLEKYDIEEIKETISLLQKERNMLAKNANMGAIAEYRKKETDYLARVAELDQVTEERNEARKEHEELRRQRLEMFMEGFGTITLKLKEMYQMITLGGDAELELVDSLDPFSEGIVFSVRPPKKSWKNISNLSGGEKTLSSLSLVFALHHFRPTPLYVMDEIDAALDFKNVSIVANYIKERTRNAQFIIISLRNNMFELADRLCGIYKVNNMTNSITIDPKAFGASAQPPLADASNHTKTPQSQVKCKS